MSVSSFEELRHHLGHHVVVVVYAGDANAAVECEDCYEVLIDFDNLADVPTASLDEIHAAERELFPDEAQSD